MNQQTMSLLSLGLLFVILYFLMIRPQRKREKQINSMRSSIKVGDQVLTIGGIYGKVIKAKDDRLTIEVGSDKTRFEIARWGVSSVIEAAPENRYASSDAEDNDEDDSDKKSKKVVKKTLKKEEPEADSDEETKTEE